MKKKIMKKKTMKESKRKRDEFKAARRGDCNNCKTYQTMYYYDEDEYDDNLDLSEIELLKDWD